MTQRYCQQEIAGLQETYKFPVSPMKLQKQASEWMTKSQMFVTEVYGWTSLVVVGIVAWYLLFLLVRFVERFFRTHYVVRTEQWHRCHLTIDAGVSLLLVVVQSNLPLCSGSKPFLTVYSLWFFLFPSQTLVFTHVHFLSRTHTHVYQPSGEDQGIPFSTVKSISTYVPQISSNLFSYPLLGCDVDGVDPDLFDWQDPDRPHEFYSLYQDVVDLIGQERLDQYKVFSKVSHVPPPLHETQAGTVVGDSSHTWYNAGVDRLRALGRTNDSAASSSKGSKRGGSSKQRSRDKKKRSTQKQQSSITR